MDLGKIGDQNVEFLKGHLFLFCAMKLAQPFKRYDHSKIEKGEKKCQNMKNFIFFHIISSLSQFFCFFYLVWFRSRALILRKTFLKPYNLDTFIF